MRFKGAWRSRPQTAVPSPVRVPLSGRSMRFKGAWRSRPQTAAPRPVRVLQSGRSMRFKGAWRSRTQTAAPSPVRRHSLAAAVVILFLASQFICEIQHRLAKHPLDFVCANQPLQDRSVNRNKRRVVSSLDGRAVVLSVVGFHHVDWLYWKMFIKFWFSNVHRDGVLQRKEKGVLVDVMDFNRVQ
ncbi:hypothetical protein NDU88_002527 [Pleurodeles waltl]|uniref:Uncharacterized protein n=1 Tax=Pleurodeles waltl TaxID=8319 RepID=A0AAV7VBI9_PLEWA|nr:hypothetical protein NDU88_002527 [Pleurodeles waltl]